MSSPDVASVFVCPKTGAYMVDEKASIISPQCRVFYRRNGIESHSTNQNQFRAKIPPTDSLKLRPG
jgi:hypothetical protein